MLLELENGPSYRDPDAATIASALSTLDGERNTFAILSEADQVYMQTAVGPKAGFLLEYREGNAESHYRAVRDDLSIEEIVRAFVHYAVRDPSWRSAFEWKRLDMSELSSRRGGAFILVCVVILAIIALLVWAYLR